MNAILIASDLSEAAAGPGAFSGQVHSVFDHAVNCTFGDTGWLTLLTEEADIGPMGLVVRVPSLKALPFLPGMPLDLSRNRLKVPDAGVSFHFKGLPQWHPFPEPVRDPVGLVVKRQRLNEMERWVRESGNLAGIANVLDYLEIADCSRRNQNTVELNAFGQFALERIQGLIEALGSGDAERFREKVRAIIGFGPGLTPSGDDLLAGIGSSVIYLSSAYRLKSDSGKGLLEMVAQEAAGRTTRVSEEMLRNIFNGKLTKRFMAIQRALLCEAGPDLALTLRDLAAMGETSGTDHALGVLMAHRVLGVEELRRIQKWS